MLCAGPALAQPTGACNLDGPLTQAKIEQFLGNECYSAWGQPPAPRRSGALVDGTEYTAHQFISVLASPEVTAWLDGGRVGQIPDGAVIVAFVSDAAGRPQEVLTKVKRASGAADGWFWSVTSAHDPARSKGEFGFSHCLACHASADKTQLTFLSPAGPVDPAGWMPDAALKWPDPPPVDRPLPHPMAQPDQAFLDFFAVPAVPRPDVVPFPAKIHDHVVAGNHAGPQRDQQGLFLTSDQCEGCHNAGQLLSNSSPNMWYPDPGNAADPVYRNYAPFGEWSASINGLAGRDPIWHAQVESERLLRPHLADFTDNVCFSCHGAMGGRQLQIDTGNPDAQFTIAMFYATGDDANAKYGALARDGVSCAVCHHIDGTGLGVDPQLTIVDGHLQHLNPSQLQTYTALFNTNTASLLTGPFRDAEVQSGAMDRALGIGTVDGEQLGQSRLCGSCHTVIVPALPIGYAGANPSTDPSVHMSFEQTTYWEWRNTLFQNEPGLPRPANGYPLACQSCHMRTHQKGRIANIESDRFPPTQARLRDAAITMAEHEPYPRHTLMALNLFLLSMYQQFPDLLGAERPDPAVPDATVNSLLTAGDWMADHAKRLAAQVRITSLAEAAGNLEAKLRISSYTGHKFPTGAGFRRAFIEFQVFDANDNVIWASGRTSSLGVILNGTGEQPLASELTVKPWESQPHYQVITRQDQVQIYETRALDSRCRLQTTVLGIFYEYKDNRLLPLGWRPNGPMTQATEPKLPDPAAVAPIPGFGTDACRPSAAVVSDPDYDDAAETVNGGDNIVYRVPLSEIPNWARVEARLLFQAIPPYFLRDRFASGKLGNGDFSRDTKRLIHLASHLDLAGTAIENWSLPIGSPAAMRKGAPAEPGASAAQTLQAIKDAHPITK